MSDEELEILRLKLNEALEELARLKESYKSLQEVYYKALDLLASILH